MQSRYSNLKQVDLKANMNRFQFKTKLLVNKINGLPGAHGPIKGAAAGLPPTLEPTPHRPPQ